VQIDWLRLCSDECHECQERVAVKIIRKTPTNRRAVESEVEISLILDHPNVIKTYRSFEHDDNVYLVQELASGGDVCDYLAKHGAIQEERIVKVSVGKTDAIVEAICKTVFMSSSRCFSRFKVAGYLY
jgi:serine/threonine protein kinase